MSWDRFDICLAYQALENDWNKGGWLRERPSNQRRRESIGVQLLRIGFESRNVGGRFEALEDQQKEIYLDASVRFGMAPMLRADDDSHEDIVEWIRHNYSREYIAKTWPQLV